jgi:beta-lactamase regulating signal transducer with metallopeptidase domain
MLAWMVFAALVSVLVTVGGRALEEGARALRRPARFVWAGALLGVVGLTALAPARTPEPVTIGVEAVRGGEGGASGTLADAGGVMAALKSALARGRSAVTWPVRVAASAEPGPALGRTLAGVWAGSSLAALLLGAATLFRYGAARRRWPRREVCGVPVRVSPSAGPAVLGLLRPEIVVPAWLVALPEEEQRAAVLHEEEHVRARDGWTLAAGWLAVALVPWNPVAWWLWRRLRLAVELDCDARVLRHDVGRRAYGTMLIDMAGRGSGLPLGVPALAGSPTTLERRLIAMTAPFKHGHPVRAFAFAAFGALALIAACESEMPTAAEVEEMDAATAEAAARKLELIDAVGEDVAYYVDGRKVDAEEARALAPEELARVEVVREDGSKSAVIRLRTVAGDGSGSEATASWDVKLRLAPVAEDGAASGTGPFDGLLIIDGEVAPSSRMGELRPSEIESVEVIKGDAAAAISDDPRAARGIIRVITKTGGGAG